MTGALAATSFFLAPTSAERSPTDSVEAVTSPEPLMSSLADAVSTASEEKDNAALMEGASTGAPAEGTCRNKYRASVRRFGVTVSMPTRGYHCFGKHGDKARLTMGATVRASEASTYIRCGTVCQLAPRRSTTAAYNTYVVGVQELSVPLGEIGDKKQGVYPLTSSLDGDLPFFKLEGIFSRKLLLLLAFFISTDGVSGALAAMSSVLPPLSADKAPADRMEASIAPDGSGPPASRLAGGMSRVAECASTGASTDGTCNKQTNTRKRGRSMSR